MKFSAVFAASAAATVIVLLAWCLGTSNAWLTNSLNGIGCHFSRRQFVRMSGVLHSGPNPPLDATWEPVNLPEYPAVQKYLSREVTAVALPGKVGKDDYFPGLIIDGGPGVGKTQQAFALLKDGKQRLVYLLLTEDLSVTSKGVYYEMKQITWVGCFAERVDEVKAAVVAEAAQKKEDPFNEYYLAKLLQCDIDKLDSLVHYIADRVLDYDQGRNILSTTVRETSGNRKIEDSIKRLAGAVLFLDEMFPPPKSSKKIEEAISRVYFLRSLGRALKMHVVMVGSTATSARKNTLQKIDPKYEEVSSRYGTAPCGWMDIEFISSSVKLPALLGPAIYTNHKERPLVLDVLEDHPKYYQKENASETEILQDLAYGLNRKMNWFSDEAKLIWLSGCWLASTSQLPPSPFAMGPADLVRGHFFQPALAISEQDNVYMGFGNAHLQRITAPLRMVLHRYQGENDTFWWFLASDRKQAGLSPDYGGIESALSHCVQSCLATEPVLAVSLSDCHKFLPMEFRKEFSKLRKTVGPSGGILNVYFMFAALQMACRIHSVYNKHCFFPSTSSVAKMVNRMWEYLLPEQEPQWLGVVDDASTYNPGFIFDLKEIRSERTLEYSYGKEGNDDESSINDVHNSIKMPWLVPACSHEKLKEKIEETQNGKQSLFSGLWIAGLVPGFNESTRIFDASAYLWEGEDRKCVAPLEWIFEFQLQPGPYSMTQLCDHLEDKCTARSKIYKEDNEALVDDQKFHSMLVVSTGSVKSECRIWLENEKLRIVLVIGSQPYRLTWT